MSYAFPPELERLVQEKMALGHYPSEDALLLDALRALDDAEDRYRMLRDEIRSRLDRTGKAEAAPLDLESFKAELRQEFDRQR